MSRVMKKDKLKIKFNYFSSLLDKEITEELEAEKLEEDNLYKLISIPLYGPFIAIGDEFYATFSTKDDSLTYNNVLNYSENSVIHIIVSNNDIFKETLKRELINFKCNTIDVNNILLVVDIPKKNNYKIIESKLSDYESKGLISYAESCLSDKHNLDLDT